MKPMQQFDQDMRQLHAASLGAIPPQTLARLRAARQAQAQARPRRARAAAWLGASACTAVLAVVAVTHLMPVRQATPVTTPAVATVQASEDFVSTTDVLDQNPDLYVWLGSDASLALE